MPSLIGSSLSSASRIRRVLLAVAGLAAVLLAVTYAAWPWLVATVAPRAAGALGVDELSLRVGRPGLDGMAVKLLELRAGQVHLVAEHGRLGYRPAGLLAGRLAIIEFRRGVITLTPAPATRPDTEAEPTPDAAPLQVDAAFAALPADRLVVEHLQVQVPAVDFRSVGTLQVDRQHLALHLDGQAPAEAEPFDLHVSASAAGAVTARLEERTGRRPILDVVTRVIGSSLALDGEVALAGFALELAALLAGLPAGDGAVDGSFRGRLPWPLPDDGDWSGADGEGRLTAHWQPAGQSWSLSEATAHGRFENGSFSGELSGSVTLSGRSLNVSGVVQHLDPAGPNGAGTLTVTTAPVERRVAAAVGAAGIAAAPAGATAEASMTSSDAAPLLELGWQLELDRLELDGTFHVGQRQLDWLPEDVRPPGSGTVTGRLTAALAWPLPEQWRSLDATAEGTLTGQWRVPDPSVGFRQLEGEWHLEQRRLAGELAGTLAYRELHVPVRLELAALEPVGQQIVAHGTAVLGDRLHAPFRLLHDPDSGAGSVAVEVDHRIEAPLAQTLADGWTAPFDLVGGRIGLDAELAWPAEGAAEGAVAVALDEVDASYGEYRLSGLHADLDLMTRDGAWSLAPARLHVDELHTGVVLQDIDTGIAWADDLVSVDGVSAHLLGGTARTDAFAYRIGSGEADLVVDLADLSLARVLELEGEHITGTGTLAGRLPVQVRNNAVSVVAGRIAAAPPGGRIRVSPTIAAGTGQPGLDFALRALQNFSYTALEADVAYTGEGDLTLAVRLQGSNPEIEAGRPIHYNLTVTENVPTLLRSLRLQDEVTREIERRVTD